jgi:uncharacterized RDD family membrane protein YckC
VGVVQLSVADEDVIAETAAFVVPAQIAAQIPARHNAASTRTRRSKAGRTEAPPVASSKEDEAKRFQRDNPLVLVTDSSGSDGHADGDAAGLSATVGRVGSATGRLALRPLRAVAHAGRDAIVDEVDRAIDAVTAGPLPEALGRSLVEHRVVERLLASALQTEREGTGATTRGLDLDQLESLLRRTRDNPELKRLLVETVHSELVTDLSHEIATSPAFKQLLANVLKSPELRHALEEQTAGFGNDVAMAMRRRAMRADERIEATVHRWLRRPPASSATSHYAGLGTRGIALAADAVLVQLVFLVGGALIQLVASLFGGVGPAWLVGLLAGSGWLLLVVAYFVGFWSTVGQTPGMRLLRIGVITQAGAVPSGGRSLVRLVGLALAVIPMFAGFLPVLFDARRRALQDYLAGTSVVYRNVSTGE